MLKVYLNNDACDEANLTDSMIDRDLKSGRIFRDLYCDDIKGLAEKLLYIHEYGCVDYILHTRNTELIDLLKSLAKEKGFQEDLIFIA